MTCKECLWCDVCKSRVTQFGYDFDEDKEVPEFGCGVVVDGFKNKADFVEVVRCKDCKCCEHCYPAKAIGEEAIEGWYCKIRKKHMQPYDFCSYGERRTDNDL